MKHSFNISRISTASAPLLSAMVLAGAFAVLADGAEAGPTQKSASPMPLLAKAEPSTMALSRPTVTAPISPPTSMLAQQTSANDSQGSRALLIPYRETILVSPIVGRINRINGELGGSFREGATLVEFDCKENHAKLRMAEAEYNSALQGHEGKLRLQGLEAAGELEVATAAALMEKAKAQIEINKIQIEQCTVAAPFAGRIVKMSVKQHQGVNVGQSMIEVVSAGMPKVRVNAPSKWLAWLKPGKHFELQIDETGKSYTAEITSVNGRVDAASQSIEIEGRLRGSNPELLAGMSGNARFRPRH